MVVALFAPPLEARIRWVAPFYALTIAFRKPNCAHLASDSVVDQATSSILQAACCLWSSSSCAPNQLKVIRQKKKPNPKKFSKTKRALQHETGSVAWPPPNSTENPDSQKSSPIKLLILKKCSFASQILRRSVLVLVISRT